MASGGEQETQTRKIAIAVDLSDESAYALQWAVKNYLRPHDYVSTQLSRLPRLGLAYLRPMLGPCWTPLFRWP